MCGGNGQEMNASALNYPCNAPLQLQRMCPSLLGPQVHKRFFVPRVPAPGLAERPRLQPSTGCRRGQCAEHCRGFRAPEGSPWRRGGRAVLPGRKTPAGQGAFWLQATQTGQARPQWRPGDGGECRWPRSLGHHTHERGRVGGSSGGLLASHKRTEHRSAGARGRGWSPNDDLHYAVPAHLAACGPL